MPQIIYWLLILVMNVIIFIFNTLITIKKFKTKINMIILEIIIGLVHCFQKLL